MDQACAYGNQPIAMIFDGELTEVIELKVPQDLYVVIVELGAAKNTQVILSKLNECYPFAKNKLQKNVQQFLGKISYEITQAAIEALQTGDAKTIGMLMKQAQADFDQYLISCPVAYP